MSSMRKSPWFYFNMFARPEDRATPGCDPSALAGGENEFRPDPPPVAGPTPVARGAPSVGPATGESLPKGLVAWFTVIVFISEPHTRPTVINQGGGVSLSLTQRARDRMKSCFDSTRSHGRTPLFFVFALHQKAHVFLFKPPAFGLRVSGPPRFAQATRMKGGLREWTCHSA